MEKFTIRVGRSLLFLALGLVIQGRQQSYAQSDESNQKISQVKSMESQTITLGAGCFWCVEAVFANMKGVDSVTSGYMGGHIKNPAYREVCTGRTGHAEVIQVKFNPESIDLIMILEVFFSTHDPTTLNRQGADVGTQYRSAIFFHETEQQSLIDQAISQASLEWSAPIVTEVQPSSVYYIAEDYHQSYYELHGEAPYCRAVIAPKMKKFQEKYSFLLKR